MINTLDRKKEIICAQCRLKFQDVVSLKLHLATEFHLYNAKRRVAELDPISEELFVTKKAGKHYSLLSCTNVWFLFWNRTCQRYER